MVAVFLKKKKDKIFSIFFSFIYILNFEIFKNSINFFLIDYIQEQFFIMTERGGRGSGLINGIIIRHVLTLII
jgi:hypothetical protein